MKAAPPIYDSITGVHINYYFTCPRKLWLYDKGLQCEQESEEVKIGKFYHEDYEGKALNIERVKIDNFIDGKVWELKKSWKNKEASIFQVLFYLYVLKLKGVETTGVIRFKENNRKMEVELTPDKEVELLEVMERIGGVCRGEEMPEIGKKKGFCKRCSYYELCFI